MCSRPPGTGQFRTRVDPKMLWWPGHRPTHSFGGCSPSSRRVAPLRPRYAGLSALTTAPRTPVQTGSYRTMPNSDPLHVVVDDLSRFRRSEATVDTWTPQKLHRSPRRHLVGGASWKLSDTRIPICRAVPRRRVGFQSASTRSPPRPALAARHPGRDQAARSARPGPPHAPRQRTALRRLEGARRAAGGCTLCLLGRVIAAERRTVNLG